MVDWLPVLREIFSLFNQIKKLGVTPRQGDSLCEGAPGAEMPVMKSVLTPVCIPKLSDIGELTLMYHFTFIFILNIEANNEKDSFSNPDFWRHECIGFSG
ncbi:hypothetical protein [Providencia stuartii]|uniref:hypothetical protein n=1 Tax=Providencia stuartii TaxID=588 RepID=UPI0024AAE5D4|nr:hypothetical protein [Providencia stuartii]MCX3071346.1 hypothetical protein [Providencia stuartii]